jgi:DNA-binding NarL/FixJ family response regulator
MRTYLLADNQDITREGLIALLNESGLCEKIAIVKTRRDLSEGLRIYPSAVVVLDYTLFDFSSCQQMLITKDKAKESSWILFSEELGEHFLRQALVADPSLSVVMKYNTREEIATALHHAAYRIAYHCELAGHVLENQIPPPPVPDKLTVSEKAILHEIALGKTTKEIAWERNLSFHTVNSHRKNIFRKLQVNNVQEAIKCALQAGLLDITDYSI